MQNKIIKKYCEFLEDMLNDFDYSNIDTFAEENNLSEDEIDQLLSLSIKVTLENNDIEQTEYIDEDIYDDEYDDEGLDYDDENNEDF